MRFIQKRLAVFVLCLGGIASGFGAERPARRPHVSSSTLVPACLRLIQNGIGLEALEQHSAKPGLATRRAVVQMIPFIAEVERCPNPEELWQQTHPLGLHPITSEIPAPKLSQSQVQGMKNGFQRMRETTREPTWMLNRIVAKMIEMEGRFLRDNLKRIEGLEDSVRWIDQTGKNKDRRESYVAEVDALRQANVDLEQSILAKFADFATSYVINSVEFTDLPEDRSAIARATYQAALHRAHRLNLPFEEFKLASGEMAIRYLPHEGTDLGKLIKTVERITSRRSVPFRVMFSPLAVLKRRYLMSVAYLDREGNFGVSPHFLLAGDRDHLNTPMHLRALQMFVMQERGNPTPFRGAVMFEDPVTPTPLWLGLYRSVLEGPLFRYFPKAFRDAGPELKLDMATSLFVQCDEKRQALLVNGVDQIQASASQLLEVLSAEDSSSLIVRTGFGYLLAERVAADGQEVSARLVLQSRESDPLPNLILQTSAMRFQVSLDGRDFRKPFADLHKLVRFEGEEVAIEKTFEVREALIRILRVLQRSTDVSQGVFTDLTGHIHSIRKAAETFVETPNESSEKGLLEALSKYREPSLDRLSLRGIGKPEPKGEPLAIPRGTPGPRTPSYLIRDLHVARAMGASGAGAYRKAIEAISVNAVRTWLESNQLATRDRGPDQLGYDILASSLKDPTRRFYVEVKGTSDLHGTIGFTAAEIQFARNHLPSGDWVLAVVVIDEDGSTMIHFRNGIDLGPPLPPQIERRPILLYDLLTLGREVAPHLDSEDWTIGINL